MYALSICGLILLAVFIGCARQDQPQSAAAEQEEADPVPEPEPSFVYSAENLAGLEKYVVPCDAQEIDLAIPVGEIARALEDSVLLYNVKPLTDCSGIFHRVLHAMQQRCPQYPTPDVAAWRDSRDLAQWYHERNELILVEDAVASADLIKPGAVLFYGQRDSVYKNFEAEELFQPRTGINHVGVVVAVTKNDSGQVESYRLFHGHGSTGKTAASITDYHWRVPTRPAYPPFGNGREQWVAFALLVNPSGLLMTAK
jgi:hypothetical protein